MYRVDLKMAEFSGQTDQALRDMTIGDALRERAALTPDRLGIAAIAADADPFADLASTLSYSHLVERAEDLAASLLSRFAPGERIAIWAPNSLEWMVLEFASALAGLPFVTVNPSSQARELRFVLEQSGSSGLFTVESYRGNPMWEIARTVVAELPAVRELTRLDDHESLHRQGDRVTSLPVVRPDDPAMIIYTSGTTGVPKGVILTHKSVINNSRFVFERLDPPAGQPVVTSMPLFHVGGCVAALLGAMQQGCPLLLMNLFDPVRTLQLIERHRAGSITGVPTMIFALVERQERMGCDLSSLQRVLCGGASVAPELIRRVKDVLGSDLQNIYGQTEVSGVLTQTHLDDDIEDASETIGQPLPMTDVSIRDTRTGEVLPTGEVGEICARGYSLMDSYNENPDGTAAAFHAGGWLRTGDLGTMDRRGYLRITGRVKEMIIRGGENIYPAEIENVLLEHPSVGEVAVVGLPDERWGEIIACFVRVGPGEQLDEAGLIQHCRSQISPQKTPSRWIAVTDWPLTGSGKIQKFALRDMLLAGQFG
jgi:fatty-acyl-CoA synthase